LEKKSKSQINLIDVSGFNYSGKSAVMDVLREFNKVTVHPKKFEFLLIRMTDGLLDLKKSLLDNWSPIRSDIAIKRFSKLINVLNKDKTSLLKPKSLFEPTGQNYKNIVGEDFKKVSEEYIDNLVKFKVKTFWPFEDFSSDFIKSFYIKFLNAVGKYENTQFFAYDHNFVSLTQDYLNKVLSMNLKSNCENLVTSNAIEVFKPSEALELFPNYKLIIVDRNPIDSFIAYSENKNFSKKDFEIEAFNFFKRYSFFHEISNKYLKNHEKILIVNFENLIKNYEDTLNQIKNFLNLESEQQEKFSLFKPLKSKIGMLNNCKYQDLFNQYSQELEEYEESIN
tara:strand:- start:199 stop:1212 length:1014 start_codon:yes stop_codon:yes gene_type:complete